MRILNTAESIGSIDFHLRALGGRHIHLASGTGSTRCFHHVRELEKNLISTLLSNMIRDVFPYIVLGIRENSEKINVRRS